MAHVTLLCLLLLTSSLHHVISFAVRRRQGRSTDLGDALRMLERQRRRLPANDGGFAGPQELGSPRLTMEDVQALFSQDPTGPDDNDISAEWLAKTLGLDGYGAGDGMDEEGLGEDAQGDFPPQAPPQEQEPSDEELDAIFGEKSDDAENDNAISDSNNSNNGGGGERESSPPAAASAQKKDKEVMTDVTGDAVPKVQTRSSGSGEEAETGGAAGQGEAEGPEDDVRLTRGEFQALLQVVERLQKQALESAQQAGKQAQGQLAQAEQQAEEAEEEVEKEVEEAEQDASDVITAKPQPVSDEELDDLFEEKSEEVIPTENGEVVKTDRKLTDPEGRTVGREEEVREVEAVPGDKDSLASIEDFWFLKNYLEQDGDRKKRNSKRNFMPPSLASELSPPDVITSPDPSELIAAYVRKINQLQSSLDRTRLMAYLEDVENDILTDALNEATLAQVKGRVNPNELASLRDAIHVEEALQQVKNDRLQAADLADELADEIASSLGDGDVGSDVVRDVASDAEKRGEPWRKRDDVSQSEIPVYVAGDDEDEQSEDDVIPSDDDMSSQSTALSMGNWFANDNAKVDLDDIFNNSPAMLDQQQIAEPSPSQVASLFSNNAGECPAVVKFSTNCEFAGDSIDFEARALCNVHEMCYSCGASLGVDQGQCDFIYRAASSLLCRQDSECQVEAELFLNTMKLKHRYVLHGQPLCRSRCTATFLSII